MTTATPLQQAFTHHPRAWKGFKYLYPVISRRAKGLSIGINLSPNQFCNLNCIYCCIDRAPSQPPYPIDLFILKQELTQILGAVKTGEIWLDPPFKDIPQDYRRLNDIAFSGDGEPTLSPSFPQGLELATQTLQQLGLAQTCKTIIITNATTLHLPPIQAALRTLKNKNATLWAKLDAGSADYYRKINQSAVPYQTIVQNILTHSQAFPTTIQTLLLNIHNTPMPDQEFLHYIHQLRYLLKHGAQLQTIQLYTTARETQIKNITPISEQKMNQFRRTLISALPGLHVETFV